jgi:hypothetical protein
MMKRMGSFQKFVVGAFLISILLLILVGCPDQYVAKKGEQQREVAMHPSPDTDLKAGDLIVGWEDKRAPLEMKALKHDLDKNGAPGGGGSKDIVMMTFYRADGTSFVANLEGKEIKPCARIIDGKAVPVEWDGKEYFCENLSGVKITGIQKVTVNTSHSPDCSVDFYCNYALQGPCR